MRKITIALAILLIASIEIAAQAQRKEPPTKAELAAITERGKMLAEYDTAAWHSTDAVAAHKPTEGSVTSYVAKKTGAGWSVVYGRLNEKRDRYLVVYEAAQAGSAQQFTVTKHEPPKEDAGFYLSAARALEIARADFKRPDRPYNAAVIPAPKEQLWVYLTPAPTKHGVWPHGGDVRYLISKDGKQIVEKRQLHKSILESRTAGEDGSEVKMGFHTAILADIPEDTDVFLVLTRKPLTPEAVVTENFVYLITINGTIVPMRKEDFLKLGNK